MIALVVGGAKSGKSMFAQDLANSLESKNGKLHYVATMNPYDLEDLKRILVTHSYFYQSFLDLYCS